MRTRIIVACITFLFALGLLVARTSVDSARSELSAVQRDQNTSWDYFRDATQEMGTVYSLQESGGPDRLIVESISNVFISLGRAANQTPTVPSRTEDVLPEAQRLLNAARNRLAGFDEELPVLEERVKGLARVDTAMFIGTLIMGLLSTVVAALKE